MEWSSAFERCCNVLVEREEVVYREKVCSETDI